MDCSNSTFPINCESNPAFYRKCSVQWMEGWSESSMMKVSGGGKEKQFQETAIRMLLSAFLYYSFNMHCKCFSPNLCLCVCMHAHACVCCIYTSFLYQIPELLLAKKGGKGIDKKNTSKATVSGGILSTY